MDASSYDLTVSSFYMAYALLLTTGLITFIEALRTPELKIRNMMNLETSISFVATYFYGVFVSMIGKSKGKPIDFKKINQLRYMDWSITTPLMLVVLITVLLFNTDKKLSMGIFAYILVFLLNYGMLGFGYLGDAGVMERTIANVFGFACYALLFGFIFVRYVQPRYHVGNYVLFFSYAFIWGLYGIAYFFDDAMKNLLYNILDVVAKAMVGILLWAFYTKVFHVEKFHVENFHVKKIL